MGNNLADMKARLEWRGGNQEHRMVKDKERTFQRALLYSYQGCDVQKEGSETTYRALINPDKNKKDYDDKILSISFEAGFQPGDIFVWKKFDNNHQDTHWLVFLQELTEDAYFRSEIRRCKYQIEWIDEEAQGIYRTWAYIRGPVETKINSIYNHGITADLPNWSLEIYIPKNEYTERLKRYTRFYFNGLTWEIQVIDSISQEGVIELICLEDYTNQTHDVGNDKTLTDDFKVIPYEGNTPIKDLTSDIVGPTFMNPTVSSTYTHPTSGGVWSIKESNRPITLTPNDNSVVVTWNKLLSGQFTLVYTIDGNDIEKIIVVESLF